MARIDDYKESFRLASEKLKRADIEHLAKLAEVDLVAAAERPATLIVPLLGTPFHLRIGEEIEIWKEGVQGDVPLPEKILICHYLLHASGEPPKGELITFRQIPDGHFYFDAFQRRARDPLLAVFGADPELFKQCAQVLGGMEVQAGDVARTFRIFPRISVHLVLWEGDDEFPPEAGILFDANIQKELPAEDIAVMSGMLVYRLMGIAKSFRIDVSSKKSGRI